MTLDITQEKEISIVMIPQRFDAATAPGTEAGLKAFLAGSAVKKLILDFSRTEYVASAGLKVVLVITRDLMKSGGRVVLAGLTPAVLRVFEMAGFTSIFSISASREEAVRQLS
jgi:anti-anti-sigma factor